MAKDRNGPLYQTVSQEIENRISSGELKPGDQLPSERELCSSFSVSRITIRRAIQELASRGLVDRMHGVGTFVSAEKVKQPLDEVHSFTATMARLGRSATTEIVSSNPIAADFGFSKILGTPVGAPLRRLELLGFSDMEPVVVYESWLEHQRGDSVEDLARKMQNAGNGFSTLDIHRELQPGIRFRLEQSLEAAGANSEIANLLQVDQGSPVMRVETIISDSTGPLEYRISHYRGDKYKFALERSMS